MGVTNLKAALENKMGLWAGELQEQEELIAEIQSLFETLPERTRRAERLKTVLGCATVVMTEIDPTWTEDRVKASRPAAHKSPVPLGQIAKLTLDILREAPEPLTTREITLRVLERSDLTNQSRVVVDKTVNSVNASLRQKQGVVVDHDGGYPQRWRSIVK